MDVIDGRREDMISKVEFLKIHWNYYLMLEEDFRKTIRFVELDPSNFNTFSVEFSKQLQSICSEFDVICKSICKFYNCKSSASNIQAYAAIILSSLPDITCSKVSIIGIDGVILTPLKFWIQTPYQSPKWWKEYNAVKHNRFENFNKANLENVLNALAALYILELNLLKLICIRDGDTYDIPHKASDLFELEGWITTTNLASNLLFELKN